MVAVRSYSPITGATSKEKAEKTSGAWAATISLTARSCTSLTNDQRKETAIASTPASTRLSTAAMTSASSSATSTSPSRSIRSLTPRISSVGTIGSGLARREAWTRSRSWRPAIFE